MISRAIKLASLIKEQRKIHKLSQEKLSQRLGWGPKGSQVISNIERGVQQIPPKQVNRLSIELMIDRSKIIDAMVADYQHGLMAEIDKAQTI
jgi:transcriptional regulator with XRE-family HTH domain